MPPNNGNKPLKNPPFHRVNSRNFNSRAQPDGLGYDCGCRDPAADYSETELADILTKGAIDLADGLIPPFIRGLASLVLKAATDKDLDEYEKELAKFLAQKGEGFIFAQALRSIPAWVPVDRRVQIKDGKKVRDVNFKEVDREIEGQLTRSFLGCLDLPLLPWNRWYNWNFHVRIDPGNGFEHVAGRGNSLNRSEVEDLGGGINENADAPREAFDMFKTSGPRDNSFECIMDVGAFSNAPGNGGSAGIMFDPGWPFWPMARDHFWCQGRWVYDCTHVQNVKVVKPGSTATDSGQHWTQIHPARAFASHRFEGFQFEENDKAVLASRLLFTACRKGGYIDFDDFGKLAPEDDPVFIVDLPPPPLTGPITWPIGHTPDFPMNTLVLRPRLLVDFDFAPFKASRTLLTNDLGAVNRSIDPTVELIKSDEKVKLPDQAKITFPLSKLPAGTGLYGVVVSIGWFDPTGELAARIKKVTVAFDHLEGLDKDGELRLMFAANGRWQTKAMFGANKRFESVGQQIPLLVPDDGRIQISAHGARRNSFGRFFERNTDAGRQLRVGGLIDPGPELQKAIDEGREIIIKLDDGGQLKFLPAAAKELLKSRDKIFGPRRDVTWKGDVDQDDNEVASAVARELFFKPFKLTSDKDEPLGLLDDATVFDFQMAIDAGSNRSYVGHNMSEFVKDRKIVQQQKTIKLRGFRTRVVGDAHMEGGLVKNRLEEQDYVLQYTIIVQDQ